MKDGFSKVFGLGLACQAKGQCCHTKTQPMPKYLRKKTSKSANYHLPLRYKKKKKKRPVKITMYLGLDIIIKLKFTTDFDRCAILSVLNYLTKNRSPDPWRLHVIFGDNRPSGLREAV